MLIQKLRALNKWFWLKWLLIMIWKLEIVDDDSSLDKSKIITFNIS